MRLFALLANAWIGLRFLLGLPFRALRARGRPRIVELSMEGDVPWREAGRRSWPFFRRTDPRRIRSLEQLGRELKALGRDERLSGVLLKVRHTSLAPAKLDRLEAQLEAFKSAGKRVWGHAVSASNADYEVLCLCDRILLPAGGRLELLGYAAEASNVARALGALGVTAHFVRRGDYKTAPELFTHESISDIQRRTIEELLEERYQRLVRAVAVGRRLDPEAVRRAVDQGPYSARRAERARLVDALKSERELPAYLAEAEAGAGPLRDAAPAPGEPQEEKPASFAAWAAARPFRPVPWRPLVRRPRVGLVRIEGMIVPGRGAGPLPMARVAASESVCHALRQAREDRAAAVVLHVQSPGGSALASEEILEEAQALARKKPLVAYCERVAASGGYMAALGAKEIWSDSHAVVGSIGVFAGKFDLSELFERVGVSRAVITRGAHAAIFSSSRGLTEDERVTLEADVEETYQAFLAEVAKARGQSTEEVHQKAEGRVYSGARALSLGLVDKLGTLEDALERALYLAGRAPRAFEVAHFQPRLPRVRWQALLERALHERVFALWWPDWQLSI